MSNTSSSEQNVIVLKLGGSVLSDERAAFSSVHEIYGWVRRGWRVVAVVSAFKGETDALLTLAAKLGVPADGSAGAGGDLGSATSSALAAWTALGETRSAAWLALALARAGIPAEVADPASVGLITSGPALDADPAALDAARVFEALTRVDVLVIPGFVGRDASGRPTLLGRGGSDLTALFVGKRLNARVKLLKDVGGVFDRDPARTEGARRFGQVSWSDAATIEGRVLQRKAAKFASEHLVEFEIGGLGPTGATRVGGSATSLEEYRAPTKRLRVTLLGHGSVGGGVREAIERLSDRFEIVRILVRDRDKAIRSGAAASPVTLDARDAMSAESDVVIEALGGEEPATSLILAALEAGRHVVTANKAVIARHGLGLERIASGRGVRLLYSAAVGGGVPMIEAVRRAAAGGLESLAGVVNGTTNFVLGRLAAGASFEAAVQEAQRAGFAEADPSRDLDGRDAEDKLRILIREAFGAAVSLQIDRTPLSEATLNAVVTSPPWSAAIASGSAVVRYVARAIRTGPWVRATLRPEAVAIGDPLAGVHREENVLVLGSSGGRRTIVAGKGAGRWPTAEAVIADVLDLSWGDVAGDAGGIARSENRSERRPERRPEQRPEHGSENRPAEQEAAA